MPTAAFYVQAAPAVQAAVQGTPIYPSVVLAQLGLESGMGKSQLAARYHNYFGHKASSKWKGPTVRFATPNDAQKFSTFRVYASLQACLASHVVLLNSPLYRAAQQAPTPYAQVAALAGTYAEDRRYAVKLADVMGQNELTRYDPAGGSALAVLGLLAAGAAAYHYRGQLQRLATTVLS